MNEINKNLFLELLGNLTRKELSYCNVDWFDYGNNDWQSLPLYQRMLFTGKENILNFFAENETFVNDNLMEGPLEWIGELINIKIICYHFINDQDKIKKIEETVDKMLDCVDEVKLIQSMEFYQNKSNTRLKSINSVIQEFSWFGKKQTINDQKIINIYLDGLQKIFKGNLEKYLLIDQLFEMNQRARGGQDKEKISEETIKKAFEKNFDFNYAAVEKTIFMIKQSDNNLSELAKIMKQIIEKKEEDFKRSIYLNTINQINYENFNKLWPIIDSIHQKNKSLILENRLNTGYINFLLHDQLSDDSDKEKIITKINQINIQNKIRFFPYLLDQIQKSNKFDLLNKINLKIENSNNGIAEENLLLYLFKLWQKEGKTIIEEFFRQNQHISGEKILKIIQQNKGLFSGDILKDKNGLEKAVIDFMTFKNSEKNNFKL